NRIWAWRFLFQLASIFVIAPAFTWAQKAIILAVVKSLTRYLAVLLLALFLPIGSAGADQTDKRLDELFTQLREAEGIGEARPIEISIWQIWTYTDDRAVAELMRESASAMEKKDYERALRYLDQVVEIAPDYSEGWNRRATVNYLAGRYSESLDDIARTLALEPRHFGALSGRGLVFSALEKPEEALESYEKALEVHPHLIGARISAEALREAFRKQEI
ncbi:MAG: tetratricopeptide repeat protein, partial [Kiloniellales bacterium]|nr:tetratricopeptide repeat protein [Kiloniellales bacterium]